MGNQKCLNCNSKPSSFVGFVVSGIFCNRTVVPKGAPSKNPSYPWFIKKNSGKKICLCKGCGVLLSRDGDSNIVGFLSDREYTQYKKDAELCKRLHTNGYVVLEKEHLKSKWLLGDFGIDHLKECFRQKGVKISNLKDHKAVVNGKETTGTRRWASWEGDTNFLQEIFSASGAPRLGPSLPLVDSSIIHADASHAVRARTNYLKQSSDKPGDAEFHTTIGHEHEQTIELVDLACLWRCPHVEEVQRIHADTDAGHYHLVMPLSSEDYEIEVFESTHGFTVRSKDSDYNVVMPSWKRVLHLKMGQILIFCSNLAHCGGRSRYASKNMEGIKQTIPGVKWFTDEETPVADLSIHGGLQNKLSQQTIASNYETGKTEFIRVQHLDEMKIDAVEKGELIFNLFKKRTKAIIDLSMLCNMEEKDTPNMVEKDTSATAVSSSCCLLLCSHLTFLRVCIQSFTLTHPLTPDK